MPPIVATVLTIAFMLYLFRRDIRANSDISNAIWLPTLWFFIMASRPVTTWLSMFGIPVGGGSLEGGSPLDALFYLFLIVAGILVLQKRAFHFSQFLQPNLWVALFLLYCSIAILWSDTPLSAFKRWIKVIGHPVMVLIIFTDPAPATALRTMMKRCAFVVLPVSILFIKYYPQWGRGFDAWTGEGLNLGIAMDKNMLGAGCFILGAFFVWHFLRVRQHPRSKERRNELLWTAFFLWMIWWVLSKAHSSTSMLSLLIAVCVMLILGLPFINKRTIGLKVMGGVLALVLIEQLFGVYDAIVKLLGKEDTIGGRQEIWNRLLLFDVNPLLGAGFESFWLGDRLDTLWAEYWWQPNQAHNGYLETYLNLGIVGVAILAGMIIATYRKAHVEFIHNSEFARFRLGLLAAIIAYNWTEAAFKGLHVVSFAFYLIAIDLPSLRSIFGPAQARANPNRQFG